MRMTTRCIAAAAMILPGFLAQAEAEAATLNVTATPSIFKPMFEEFVTAFTATNPDVEINLDASNRDQTDMVQSLLRRALIDDLPDVTFQGFNYMRVLVDRELAVPLDDFIKADPDWTEDRFTQSVASSASLNGITYGLGVGMSFPVLYYNADLVKQARNGDAGVPRTWDGLIDLARKINDLGSDISGLILRTHPWVFQAMVESVGGRMMDNDEKEIAFAGSKGLEVFDISRRVGEAGQAENFMTREQGRQAFAGGKVGLTLDSSSSLASFEKQAEGNFVLGTAPMPRPAANASIPAAGIASVMITRDPETQKAAWRFMKFVSSPEGQVIVGKSTGYVPANGIAATTPGLLGDYYAANKNMNAAIDTLPVASLWYAFPGENSAKIDKAIEAAMVEVVTLRQTPEEAMKSLEANVRSMLPK
jgi:multiple sugar transport system substrate-binding protein